MVPYFFEGEEHMFPRTGWDWYIWLGPGIIGFHYRSFKKVRKYRQMGKIW